MSVDTKAKRFQMLSFGDSDGALLPDPDALGIETTDRAHHLWLYGGIALGEPVVVTAEIGGGKHGYYPPQPLISPREYRRGWKEHVSSVEKEILAKHVGVEKARQFKVQKQEQVVPKRKPRGITPPKREKAARPDPVNRLEANKQTVETVRQAAKVDRGIPKPPSEKSLPPRRVARPVRKPIGRLEELRQQRRAELQQKKAVEARQAAEKKIEQEIAADEKARLGVIDSLLSEELAAKRIAASKRRKSALVNLELASKAKKKKAKAKKKKPPKKRKVKK